MLNFRETLTPHKHRFTLLQCLHLLIEEHACFFLSQVEFVIDFICHCECV